MNPLPDKKTRVRQGRKRDSLVRRLRERVRQAIKEQGGVKSAATLELIGCSVLEVRAHLEKLFLPGMTWTNHGFHGWHIDHIKPCAAFDLSDPKQQRECFHWTNLQPLWAEDNLRKQASW